MVLSNMAICPWGFTLAWSSFDRLPLLCDSIPQETWASIYSPQIGNWWERKVGIPPKFNLVSHWVLLVLFIRMQMRDIYRNRSDSKTPALQKAYSNMSDTRSILKNFRLSSRLDSVPFVWLRYSECLLVAQLVSFSFKWLLVSASYRQLNWSEPTKQLGWSESISQLFLQLGVRGVRESVQFQGLSKTFKLIASKT